MITTRNFRSISSCPSSSVLALLAVLAFCRPAAADDQTDCINSENPDRAIPACTRLLRTKPDFLSATYAYRGSAYVTKQDYDHALADLNEAIRLGRREFFVYGLRGMVHLQKNEYDQAIADFTELIRLNPPRERRALSHSLRGEAYEKLGRKEEAIADFRAALTLDPSLTQSKEGLNGRQRAAVDEYQARLG